MKKIIYFIILLSTFQSYSQVQAISIQEANQYADKLFEVDILSGKGRRELKMFIERAEDELSKYRKDTATLNLHKLQENDLNFTKSIILLICTDIFNSEMEYRTGMVDAYLLRQKIGKKNLNKAQMEALSKELESREWNKIEDKIKDEDNFPDHTSMTTTIGDFKPKSIDSQMISNNRSVLGKTCKRTLSDLLKIGLIDRKIYDETLLAIPKNELYLEPAMMAFITERARFYDEFQMEKRKQLAFINKLEENKLLLEENKKRLLQSYKEYEIKQAFDFVEYLNNSKVFDLSKYSNQPEIGFKQVFDDLTNLIPDIKFDNFKVSIENHIDKEYRGNSIERRAKIEFETDGNKYRNSFFYDLIDANAKEKSKDDLWLKIQNNFHKGINKFLADKNSPFRLYFANKKDKEGVYGKDIFGVILMTQKQFETINEVFDDYFIFKENHDNSFNSIKIASIIDDFEKIGLFSHLTQEEILIGKNKIQSASDIQTLLDILSYFPKCVLESDGEMGNVNSPYLDWTKRFSDISRGTFNPKNIKDSFLKDHDSKKKTTLYSFEMNGKVYKTNLEIKDDWIDFTITSLIESAIKDNHVEGEFYYVNQQFVFLTKQQHSFLIAKYPQMFKQFGE